MRHDYMRGMLGLDINKARDESYGWVLLGRTAKGTESAVRWVQHTGHGVILGVTGPRALADKCDAICSAAELPAGALSMDYSNAQKLLVGVRLPVTGARCSQSETAADSIDTTPCLCRSAHLRAGASSLRGQAGRRSSRR